MKILAQKNSVPLRPGRLLTTRRWGAGRVRGEGEGDDTKPKEQEREDTDILGSLK